jgi:FkbM family methyltransferase
MRGNYEMSIIDWVTTFMDPTKVFVDIGAHIGTYSLHISKFSCGVESFECCPKTFNYLCANIALQKLDYKITPHRTALGNMTGTIPYYIHSPGDGGGNSCLPFVGRDSHHIQVPITTLDSFNLTNIGLMKIDVEGFEKNVLEGAQETLKRNGYPKILFESWKESQNKDGKPAIDLRSDLFEYIKSIGYTIVQIRGWDEMFLAEWNAT